MADTEQAVLETPTDEVTPSEGKAPTRANRYRLFDDEQGDYRIYQILPKSDQHPQGTLAPIPQVGGFVSTYQARKFINNSGDLLKGKQVMIFKGLELCKIDVETVLKVQVKFKPKKAVTGPAATEAGGE
jgi:hypothetical protein